MTLTEHHHIFTLFGNILDYPTPALTGQAQRCAALLRPINPTAAGRLLEFAEFARSTDLGQQEEVYTATFDINPACTIFAGYMLFGESFDRGKFLVRLQQRYRERGFEWGRELADYVPVILRFLATLSPEEELAQNLIDKCLSPVLGQMAGSFEAEAAHPNPYSSVLRALLDVLAPLVKAPLDESMLAANARTGMQDRVQPFLGNRIQPQWETQQTQPTY